MAKILKYRVSLPGLKGFERIYELKDSNSLYSFHKRMHSDMDFPMDQIVLFKSVRPDGSAIARYSIQDLGKGTIDNVTVGACHSREEDSFVYFYDTTNKKSVLVDFVEEVAAKPGLTYPVLTGIKGPNPIEFENGYVAYEDLPEDKKNPENEDFDEDDEDIDEEDSADEEEFDEDEDEDE